MQEAKEARQRLMQKAEEARQRQMQEAEGARQRNPEMAKKLCRDPECGKGVARSGLCFAHGGGSPCQEPECSKFARAGQADASRMAAALDAGSLNAAKALPGQACAPRMAEASENPECGGEESTPQWYLFSF